MAKAKTHFVCSACGVAAGKWTGQCGGCGEWNTLLEAPAPSATPHDQPGRFKSFAAPAAVRKLADVDIGRVQRFSCGIKELDRVYGGGLVPGSVVLIGGDPGIGKSTLLLQSCAKMSRTLKSLYVTGEESLDQVALRGQRLGICASDLLLLAETRIETVLETALSCQPQLLITDSIQTLYTDSLQSAPGSVAQVRETAAMLVRYAKQTGTIVILVGHVTKEGALAGPRVLEHMVDTVLYFEGDRSSQFRIIRAVKNRFGAVNEIGVFAMTAAGLKEVGNPSSMFVRPREQQVSGTVILAAREGTRPLLVEVQALLDKSPLANPRRLSLGLEGSRLAMLLAVLHRHAGLAVFDYDVFVNVVGGLRITEPASDLAVLAAITSSFHDRVIPQDTVVFGEVGLSGELRPVQAGVERVREATKLGLKRVLLPEANQSRLLPDSIEVVPVRSIAAAIEQLYG